MFVVLASCPTTHLHCWAIAGSEIRTEPHALEFLQRLDVFCSWHAAVGGGGHRCAATGQAISTQVMHLEHALRFGPAFIYNAWCPSVQEQTHVDLTWRLRIWSKLLAGGSRSFLDATYECPCLSAQVPGRTGQDGACSLQQAAASLLRLQT